MAHFRVDNTPALLRATSPCFVYLKIWFAWICGLTTKAQACGGTDVVKRVIANLTQNTSLQRVCLVDGHGYDAFPALSVMEAGWFVNLVQDSVLMFS